MVRSPCYTKYIYLVEIVKKIPGAKEEKLAEYPPNPLGEPFRA
jgi:hypothetical protein